MNEFKRKRWEVGSKQHQQHEQKMCEVEGIQDTVGALSEELRILR